jgi:hypothetical protein
MKLTCGKALHEKFYQTSSLCNLWVLCASVVEQIVRKNNHRGSEDPEVTQRNQTFRAKHFGNKSGKPFIRI